jgi:glutamyl/glutaminyl-tRNA synthetase
VIEDQVQGRVVWQNENLDDLVLLRGDGNPTYMLAVVVDDHDMGVTHVIRGDDHLINAARQKQIYDALGWELPSMSHIPLIHGPDGSKLSKRHGALGVDAYRAMGYLPAALRNYLVRLGWSHGDQEIFSTEEMIEAFDLPAIGRSAARFDFAKLENLNGHYIRHADDQSLVTMFEDVLDYVPDGAELKAKLNDTTRAQLLQAMPSLKERAKTLIELIDGAYFIFADRPLEIEPKAAALLTPETRELIGRLRRRWKPVEPWSAETTKPRCGLSPSRARRHRHPQALRPDRDVHLRPRLHLDRELRVQDHLYRRRRGHPALPRLPDRAARRARRLPRDLLPAALRRAADRRAEGGFRLPRHAITRWCTSRWRASSRASAATRIRWR